jgi:hypothetical protein
MTKSIFPKQGWKSGTNFFASLAVLVLIVNIVLVIPAAVLHPSEKTDGSFTLYEGDCSRVRVVWELMRAFGRLTRSLGTASQHRDAFIDQRSRDSSPQWK